MVNSVAKMMTVIIRLLILLVALPTHASAGGTEQLQSLVDCAPWEWLEPAERVTLEMLSCLTRSLHRLCLVALGLHLLQAELWCVHRPQRRTAGACRGASSHTHSEASVPRPS